MSITDPDGYYRLLGIPNTAKQDAIKSAFRKLAKEYHPDVNPSPTAVERFQKIKAAYDILIDDEERRAYDQHAAALQAEKRHAENMRDNVARANHHRHHPRHHSSQKAASAHRETPQVNYLRCAGCSAITPQPRLVRFYRVSSFLLHSHRRTIEGIYCRSCADITGLRASILSWLFGWWAFPHGPIQTLNALIVNMVGGEKPARENAAILSHQATAFIQRGKYAYALAALSQAIELSPDREMIQKLRAMADDVKKNINTHEIKLVNRWKFFGTSNVFLHLLPFIFIFSIFLVLKYKK